MVQIKNYSAAQRLYGYVELMRLIEWSKSLMNMVLASLIAYYVYLAPLNFFIFVQGFFSVALLWSGLYAFNDYTDRKIDALHKVKKFRAIPLGKVGANAGLIFSLLLMIIGFGLAFGLGNLMLVGCLAAMLINQFLYTTKPFRFKSRKYLDVICGSMVNPFFRYFSGLVLFVPAALMLTAPLPILPIIFVVGIQFGGYFLYRLFSKGHDLKVKMKSTVALMSEKKVRKISYGIMVIAGLSYLGLLLNGASLKVSFLGFLPPQYFLALVIIFVLALFMPEIRHAIRKPQKADMNKSYLSVYVVNIIFVIGNVAVLLLLP